MRPCWRERWGTVIRKIDEEVREQRIVGLAVNFLWYFKKIRNGTEIIQY